MIIDCISDLHGHYPQLQGGDLLIVAGDLTARDFTSEYDEFRKWLSYQDYEKKIIIAGNHDRQIHEYYKNFGSYWNLGKHIDAHYLQDSGTEFKTFKVWGSPWTKTFHGMNPRCKAFTVDTEAELAEKWALIPGDIDILVTHCPPSGLLDEVLRETKWGNGYENTGSISLRNNVMDRIKPNIHVFGHIHEWGGKSINTNPATFINASIVNEDYKHINPPVRTKL